MATIDDVAKRAGVSVATVSRVLNNNYAVSQEKKDKVMEAVKALNYQINAAGRMLRSAETRMLLVVCTSVVPEILAGIQEAGKTLGYDILLSVTGYQPSTNESIKFLQNGMVDGVIFMNMIFKDEELLAISKQYPVVQCGEYVNIPNAFLVSTHDEKAAYAMVSHLADLGRKRIAIIVNETNGVVPNFSKERENGYRQALLEQGLTYDPSLRFAADYTYESGVAAARQILALDNRPDAVFCTLDNMAVGCINTFRAAGLNVPGDIAVSGFDNLDVCEMCDPPLTSVSQPFHAIGQETVKMLVSLIKGEIAIGRHLLLDHQLKLRASTEGDRSEGSEKD